MIHNLYGKLVTYQKPGTSQNAHIKEKKDKRGECEGSMGNCGQHHQPQHIQIQN